ncbi:GAF domain-containing protein [Streptomyces sp. NBC_00846]|uniref:GAF domain-containing protein n=1 Tax=Streptomyces sp. NBC_00846 TaxID=2975849 RepID=UPI0038642BB9|nr:GAF domain-containing protein [Streptomyces sp. NBC_00846]
MTFDHDSGLSTLAPDIELPARVGLLHRLGLGEPDPEFDAFAADLAHAAGVPYAMVNLVTNEQSFVGLHSPSDGDIPAVGRTMARNHGYCPEVVSRRLPLVLPDVTAYPRFAGNEVVDLIGIRTYAGAPLIHEPTGIVLGTVCFVGPEERPLSTGQASLDLIKNRRNQLMDVIYRRSNQ